MYHLLTGKPPIDVLARASAIVAGNPDPLELASEINKEIPVGIANVLNSALALNAVARFASAKAMRQALENTVNSDLTESAVALPLQELVAVPSVNGVILSAGTKNFPALEAFAAAATISPQTDNDDELGAVEISFPNSQVSLPAPEVLPQSTLATEEATKVSSPRPYQSRFSLAALLVLLSCVGLAAGYFITKANSSNESNQTPIAQSTPASDSNIEQSASVLDSPTPETSDTPEVSDTPVLEKTEQTKSTRVKSEPIAEKRETVAKRETDDDPPTPAEIPEKTKPAPEKSQTSRPTSRQTTRRSESERNGETRSRIIEAPVPDIESIFTGRSSAEREEKLRRQEERRRQREQMSDEELREFRRQRREQRRQRGNGNNFPF